jgi:hypothetical protein
MCCCVDEDDDDDDDGKGVSVFNKNETISCDRVLIKAINEVCEKQRNKRLSRINVPINRT